jgi:hypothetical protein
MTKPKSVRQQKAIHKIHERFSDRPEFMREVIALVQHRGDKLLDYDLMSGKATTNPTGATLSASHILADVHGKTRASETDNIQNLQVRQAKSFEKRVFKKAWTTALQRWAWEQWPKPANQDKTIETMTEEFINDWAKDRDNSRRLGPSAVLKALKPLRADLKRCGKLPRRIRLFP